MIMMRSQQFHEPDSGPSNCSVNQSYRVNMPYKKTWILAVMFTKINEYQMFLAFPELLDLGEEGREVV
jgi:hypothetical protein